MKKKIKNSSGQNKIVRGRLVAPGQMIEIPDQELALFLEDSGITDAINNGDLIMNNGMADISGVTENIKFFNFRGNGNVIMFDNTGSTLTADTIDDAIKEVAIYGSEHQYAESEGELSATTVGFNEKLKLTTANLVGGTYKIEWYYELNHNSSSSSCQARVQVDDTDTISSHLFRPQYPTDYIANSGQQILVLTSGVHDIDLDFGPESSGISFMRNARIEVYRIS